MLCRRCQVLQYGAWARAGSSASDCRSGAVEVEFRSSSTADIDNNNEVSPDNFTQRKLELYFDGLSRRDRPRYDTPTFMGLQAATRQIINMVDAVADGRSNTALLDRLSDLETG